MLLFYVCNPKRVIEFNPLARINGIDFTGDISKMYIVEMPLNAHSIFEHLMLTIVDL